MAGVPAEVEQARQRFMESKGLAHVDTHSVREGNGALYGCLPAVFCQNFGVTAADEVETYVDFDTGVVLHVPAGEVEDGGGLP